MFGSLLPSNTEEWNFKFYFFTILISNLTINILKMHQLHADLLPPALSCTSAAGCNCFIVTSEGGMVLIA
jgi:hypothetical protein